VLEGNNVDYRKGKVTEVVWWSISFVLIFFLEALICMFSLRIYLIIQLDEKKEHVRTEMRMRMWRAHGSR